MTKLLIKNGRVIDPSSKLDGLRDVLVEDGKIKAIGARVRGQGSKIIDAKGMLVLPGLIDMHVHLRDPGGQDKETIASGSRAAALGGFTSICCMANTDPAIDNPALVAYVRTKAKEEAIVNVFPIAAATKGLKGEEVTEMGRCVEEGAVAFSDDGQPIVRTDVMRRALEYAKQFGKKVISHCEDGYLSQQGAMNEGQLSTELGLTGITSLAEEIMVSRDVMLAREFGAVHVAHVSAANSAHIIRQAKKSGIPVTAETCPQYFTLTENALKNYDTNAKVNPPLKTKKDVQAIIKALNDGTIDVIATDHAPRTIEEKNVEFSLAANGMVGLETALALTLTFLVRTKALSLLKAVEKLTFSPAKILGLKGKGSLKAGSDADVVIVDPEAEWEVDPAKFASKSKNSPFAGWKLNGKVQTTIVGGKIVVKDGRLQK